MGKHVKASSGLSSVRQYAEAVPAPPIAFVVGSVAAFLLPIVFGRGHDTIRCAATNGPASPGTLQLRGAWLPAGPFILLETLATAVDPVSGLDAAEFVASFARPYLQVVFVPAGAPGLTAAFELGGFLMPIDSPSI